MNISKRTVFCMLMAVFVFLHAHAQSTITQFEYWLNYKWEARQNIPTANQINVDISNLLPGIHILGYRAGSSNGMWSSVNYKHFLIPNHSHSDTDDAITHYEYWLDYQWNERKNVAVANLFEIDIEGLSPGIHILGYRAATKNGKWSAAVYQHFIIPSHIETTEEIVAYEYWFNSEPRHRVEIAPTSTFSTEELIIPLDGISVRTIPSNYRFDVEQQIVFCPERVTFSLQLFNRKGHGSSAIVSQEFETEIPIDPHFFKMAHQEVLHTSPLDQTSIQGITVTCSIGDQLTWTIDDDVPMFDIFNAEGKKVEIKDITRNVTTEQNEKNTIISLNASSTVYYILLHGEPWNTSKNIRFENDAQTTGVSHTKLSSPIKGIYSVEGIKRNKTRKGLNLMNVDGHSYRKIFIK